LRKREFTSFDVAAVTQELKQTILGSRVSNVYQPNPKTLLFKLHKADKPAFQLVLEAGKRLHLTSYTLEKPTVPPSFCMALRKHLRNAWLTNVEQYEFERTITFTFKTKSGDVKLVLELFGEGNIILISEKGEILQALIYKRMRDRNILRGEKFAFAPSSGKNPFKISKEELTTTLADFGDVEVVRAMARFLSIGGLYAEEALLRAGVEKTKPCNALNSFEIEKIHKSLQALLSHVLDGKFEPSIILDSNGEFINVTPFKLKRYEGFNHKPYGNFNEALDDFYARTAAVEKAIVSVETENLKQEAERLKRVIESQEKALDEAKAEAEKAKKIGDIIYAHAGELQLLMEKFSAGKGAGKQWSQIVSEVSAEKKAGFVPSVFFESFDAKNLVVHVCVDEIRFSLGLRRKLFDEAGRFYERSKRARQKLEGIKAALEESRKKLAEITAKIEEAEALKHIKPTKVTEELEKRKIKRKEWFEKFRWFTSSDGLLVVAGKDAVSNKVLIKKYTAPEDVVFHADIAGAPFVVIKTRVQEQKQINASYDDTYGCSRGHNPTDAYAQFGTTAKAKQMFNWHSFLRFWLNIPRGSVINSAVLTLHAYTSRIDDFDALINYTDEDDAADFSTNPWGRTDATLDVRWRVPEFVACQNVVTYDIKSLIQHFINRENYNENNHIVIRIKHGDAQAHEYHQFYQYDGDPTKAAILTVEYIPPQTLKEAGEFAAAFSRAWREGFASADVYWVKPNQLSKSAPSGEYVPHGAFVVSGKRNWMRGIPLKVAIGVVAEENGKIKFIGGPIDAVKAKAKAYITIVPGDKSGKEFLRQILRVLAEKIPREQREKVLKASIEEIREFVPFGNGRVLE
jgi:predicted ribosome quality control (RQC) complex YloA/Tae2 family protein